MFSFVVVLVVIGGSIAIIAYVTISADHKGATIETRSNATRAPGRQAPEAHLPTPPEPPAPSRQPDQAQEHQVASGVAALLVATRSMSSARDVPSGRGHLRGLSKLLGTTAGMGFIMALGTTIITMVLMVVLRMFSNA